ncbi:MAG TPA: hypothetical protein VN048_05025 [Verrucomicrobiae bacterium]|jgi:hypothetical protein|nr:hypothetical protein [Verrucomicrobiae bacterium]
MNRRQFLRQTLMAASASTLLFRPGRAHAAATDSPAPFIDPATARDWLARWEKNILAEARTRYCDTEMGEELGWLVSPFVGGFYYGYLATGNTKWIDRLMDWTDACRKRAVREPDGFPGWPKGDGGGNASSEYSADSLLGEAMLLQPVVLLSAEILKIPALEATWGARARSHLDFAAQIFQKWDSRGCWRPFKDGGLWVVPAFGVDRRSPDKWSAGYARRKSTGFSNPDNKQNLIASWLIAMHDATQQSVYRDRASAWWRLMRARMTTRDNGKYFVWNYWEPAGAWDYTADGAPRHWVGVHPNGGYYGIDVDGIVNAYEHGLVFTRADIDRLIATNRDFMWNHKFDDPAFRRIDGGPMNIRWRKTPGVLWAGLAPYDATLRKIFIASFNPTSWDGIAGTPWAVTRTISAS